MLAEDAHRGGELDRAYPSEERNRLDASVSASPAVGRNRPHQIQGDPSIVADMSVRRLLSVVVLVGATSCSSGSVTTPNLSSTPVSEVAVQTTSRSSPPSTVTAAPATTVTAPQTLPATTMLVPVTTAPLTITMQVLYQPFTPKGPKQDVVIATETSGTCFGASVTSGTREDALRCVTDTSEILDPCFEDPFPHAPLALICVKDPTQPATRLLLSRPLPVDLQRNHTFENQNFPWAVRLANGATCTRYQGTTATLAGETTSWGCSDLTTILGYLQDQDQPLWYAVVDNDNSSSAIRVAIQTVWT